MPISWYPRNFTNPAYDGLTGTNIGPNDDQMYSVQLGLYVIGYKESKDDSVSREREGITELIIPLQIKKFRPENRVLCRLGTYQNRNTPDYRFKPQDERINLNQVCTMNGNRSYKYSLQVEQWYLNDWERQNDLFTFRFGYLKLAPIKADTGPNQAPDLLSGYVHQQFINNLYALVFAFVNSRLITPWLIPLQSGLSSNLHSFPLDSQQSGLHCSHHFFLEGTRWKN